MKKAFIFDLDGVLVSTDRLHYAAWKSIAYEEGIAFDETINNRLRGVGRRESLKIILERATRVYGEEEEIALAEKKNCRYRASLECLTEADRLEGVSETLAALRRRGALLAVGRSSKNARFILEKIGYGDYFDAVTDGNDIVNGKPDPEVFLKAAALLNLPPCDCCVVEDAQTGIEAAVRGGFCAVGIHDAAKDSRADCSLQRFSDLLTL